MSLDNEEDQDGPPASISELIRSKQGVVLEAIAVLLALLLVFRGRPWGLEAAILSAYSVCFFGITFRGVSYSLGRAEVRDALPQCVLIHCLLLVVVYGLVKYGLELIPNLHNVPVPSFHYGIWRDSGSGPGGTPYLILVAVILVILGAEISWVQNILERASEQ